MTAVSESHHPLDDAPEESAVALDAPPEVSRETVIDELTRCLSTTFRLEEKIIETVSAPSKADHDKEEEDTPATSSSSSSCSGSHESIDNEHEEAQDVEEAELADDTAHERADSSALALRRNSANDRLESILPRQDDQEEQAEEEKKDDSHDAHVLLSQLDAVSRKSAQDEIEHILSLQDGVAEHQNLVTSDLDSQQSLVEDADDQVSLSEPMETIHLPPQSQHEGMSDGSLADYASAKGTLSPPATPERSEREFAAEQQHEHLSEEVHNLPAEQVLEAVVSDEIQHEVCRTEVNGDSPLMGVNGDVSSTVADSSATSDIAGGDGARHVVDLDNLLATSENDTTDAVCADAPDKDQLVSKSCGDQVVATNWQGISASDNNSAVVTESDVHDESRERCSLDKPAREQPDVTAAQDSQSLLDLGNSARDSLDEAGNNTQDGCAEEACPRLAAGAVPAPEVASVLGEDLATANTLSMQQTLSGYLSDDSGIMDSRVAAESVPVRQDGAGHEAPSPQSPEKKKKGFFGKLKKKLIHKDGSPGKGVTSPVSTDDDSSALMRSLRGDMADSPQVPDLRPAAAISDQSSMNPIEHKGACIPPALAFQTSKIPNEPTRSMPADSNPNSYQFEASPMSERGQQVEDSVLITPASHASSNPGPMSEISIIPDLTDPSPPNSQRRLSVQASHEVAHVFRPPRPSSALSTPIHSRATSPHTSQSRSPESAQLSFASSGQYQTQHRTMMRPHLPALVGPRESFCLPPNPRKESATRTMTRLIRKDLWSHDSVQVESALLYLADVASDPDKVALIARTGGLLAIVNCMEQHTLHAGIQVAACNALEKLALDAENELAIGEVGGVEAIQGAMMTHFGDMRVQEAAWSALWNLSCGNADCSSLNHGGLVSMRRSFGWSFMYRATRSLSSFYCSRWLA